MTLLISAITALMVGLSLMANPAKIIKGVQAKTEINSNVTANTTINGSIDTNNRTTNVDVETDEKIETNTTSNVTGGSDDELEVEDDNHEKAESQERVSAENNRSGKHMPTLIPKVAVDHSDSLEESGNISFNTEH
ncbi:hypothetical protein HY338_00895 [Candidatus Gottesmanbacteria bacterium]|nr:hypothetical protein [Candidatus Gottesmanbacteria bacterium]